MTTAQSIVAAYSLTMVQAIVVGACQEEWPSPISLTSGAGGLRGLSQPSKGLARVRETGPAKCF